MADGWRQVERLPAQALIVESNRALRKGALYAFLLGVVAIVTLPILMLSGMAHNLEMPLAFVVVVTIACGSLYLMARREAVRGVAGNVIMLTFVSVPTAYFLIAHAVMPAGAATFIHGPLAYLYAGLIAVTGCRFSTRLAVGAGLMAAAGYLLCAYLAYDEIRKVAHPDPTLVQDLTLPALFGFRALNIVFVGLAVGGLAYVARRLMMSVVTEAREKDAISRLFGEYVSEQVKEKLLRDPPSRQGETRTVVILFSDVRSFTSYSERVTPEQLVQRLNVYFDEMVAAITEHGGVVDKFIGDAVMAVFGGVLELDNPCESAIAAAHAMRERLDKLNERWRLQGEPPFDNGIGIHVGVVVQGNIGSRSRKDFTVIGDAVNIASRVEGLTKTYDRPVLITNQVYEQLSPELRERCTELGPVSLRGRGAAIEVYGL